MNEVKKILSGRFHTPVWLAIILGSIIVLRIPNIFEPHWNQHETVMLTLGETIKRGFVMYRDIFTQIDPLLPFISSLVNDLFFLKSLLVLWHLITIFIFWKLSNKLFTKNERIQKISTLIFALFSTFPMLQGNLVSQEIFAIGFVMLSYYLLLSKELKSKDLITAGFLFGIAALIKYTSLVNVFVILFYWVISSGVKARGFNKLFPKLQLLFAGLLVPLLLAFIYYWQVDALVQYLGSTYLSGYPAYFRLGVLVFMVYLLMFWKKEKISKKFIFIFCWLIFSLFEILLSGTNETRILLHSLPPVALFFGMLFSSEKEQPLTIIPLSFFFFIPFYYGMSNPSTLNYYKNFIYLASGKSSNEQYVNSFGEHTTRNYKIAYYIKENSSEEDHVFVWGEAISIYALSDRISSVKYLTYSDITKFNTENGVLLELESNLPKFVILLPENRHTTQVYKLLNRYYSLNANFDGAEVWQLLDSEVRSLIAP